MLEDFVVAEVVVDSAEFIEEALPAEMVTIVEEVIEDSEVATAVKGMELEVVPRAVDKDKDSEAIVVAETVVATAVSEEVPCKEEEEVVVIVTDPTKNPLKLSNMLHEERIPALCLRQC